MKKILIALIFGLVMSMTTVIAGMELDSIQFDPAIVASGDEVDIIIQYHHNQIAAEDDRIGNPDYRLHVSILGDDSLTEKYVTIQDAQGDNLHGAIYDEGYYNKRFRVKVNNDAPAGSYEFKLVAQWYHLDEPEPTTEYVRFKMPVKKEGIVMDITTLSTVPAEVRPGDDYVKIDATISNTGQKDAKNVEVRLDLPKGLKSSYTNNNRIWIGTVGAGQSKSATFFVDAEEDLEAGLFEIEYDFEYMDLDDNEYSKSKSLPFLIKPRPHVVVIDSEGEGLAGKDGKLKVTIKNIGTESAESVDVRIIKQNSQPFSFDVRSDYVGELTPGEEGIAIFDVKTNRDAELKEYDLKLLIRSKGDTDEGDDNVYTYNRRAKFEVTGIAPNNFKTYGLYAIAIFIVLIVLNMIFKRKK